jgi:signal transduction histidine kinase
VAAGRLAVEDVAAHPLTRLHAARFAGLGIRAVATAPFVREGRWVAAIVATAERPRRWTENDFELLENVVTRVWPLVERARAEAQLRIAQAQLQQHAQELERNVAERTKSLREAIAQMEEFSYSVSHDLRGPLRAMHAYAEALVEDYGPQLDATARGYLERIQRSSVRMDKLTHDVLTYSRVARAEAAVTPIDVEKILREIIEQYAELQPAAADVTIRTPLDAVQGNESLLTQCLGNLLTNAAKFVPAGERPRIQVETEVRGDFVRIWVLDDGIGIPPEYHAALFQVFERLPTRAHYEGTGIGLAIVRKAAEKMGGRCGVESDGKHGSRFWVELPKA